MWKKRLQWLFFAVLCFLGIGQMPSVIGRLFLMLSLLVLPIGSVQMFVDEMLYHFSKRWMWFLVLPVYMLCLPGEEFSEAGKCMGLFLRRLLDLLDIV